MGVAPGAVSAANACGGWPRPKCPADRAATFNGANSGYVRAPARRLAMALPLWQAFPSFIKAGR
jgi:hypothetical protein